MNIPGRPKSPSMSSSNDDLTDRGRFGKSGSFGSKPKSSPGLVKWFKSKTTSKNDLYEASPKPDECHDLAVHSPRETSPEMSPEPLERGLSPDNFFSFTAEDNVNIWGDDFTSILKRSTIRKLSLISEEQKVAIPIQETDGTVENIGVAFVTAERTSKLLPKDVVGAMRATSPSPLDSYQKKKMVGKSTSASSLVGDLRPWSRTDAAFLATTTSSVPVPRSYPNDAESLNKVVLLERQIEELKAACWKAPSIRDTIDRILIGRSYCLEWYKSQMEKRALLDAAIDSNDGNCIITILLFIKKTVNQPILLGMLKKRPVAIRHYASFLKQLGATTELTNLYKRLEENERLADIKLQQCEAEMNPAERYAKLRDCHAHFSSTPALKIDARHVEDYARLTNQQRMIEDMDGRGGAVVLRVGTVLFRSMVTTLLYCCRYHRSKPETNTASPVALRRQFNIPEKQYFQMYLLALCVDEDWRSIENLVTTKGFMGMGKKKKSPIGFERIVKTIARKSLKPPIQILTKYLTEVDDIELRLQLATEVGVFDVGLDCLKALKDKEKLRSYINCIPTNKHWDYRPKIDALLANSQIKWR